MKEDLQGDYIRQHDTIWKNVCASEHFKILRCVIEAVIFKISYKLWRSGQALEQAAQDRGGITVPESVQKHVDVVLRDMV